MIRIFARPYAWIAAHPLAAPLLAGAVARLIAAWVGLGFHARDDYFHVLAPALRWLEDPAYDWDASDAPGAGIRSHLIPRAVWLLLRFGESAGITEPESMLRLVYTAVGAGSLLVIPAMYLLSRRLLDERGACLATWLAAVHFAMPYAGTRLLIEAMAMPPLVFGLWLATHRDLRRQLAAGLLLGLACWFRFQTGSAVLGVLVVVFVRTRHDGGWRAALAQTAALATGGLAAIGVQGLFDLWTTGDFLGPMIRNILVNLDPAPGLSRSTPFAYVGLLLLLTVPPATLVVLPAMVRAARRLPLITWPLVTFLVFHSLVPHKEDRFMLPILPLFLLLLAAAPQALADARGPAWDRLRAWSRPAWTLVIVIHVVVLALAVTNQSQANLRQAMTGLRHDAGARAVVSMGPELQAYFLGRPGLPLYRNHGVDAVWLGRTLRAAQDLYPNRFLAFAPDRTKAEILLLGFGMSCAPPEIIDGWWFDRVLYRLNPRRNLRRTPVVLWRCEPPAVAGGRGQPWPDDPRKWRPG